MILPKKEIVEKWVLDPFNQIISSSKTSGILLFGSALLAMIVANSPLRHWYHDLWEIHFSIGFDGKSIDKTLHHWINDGLMAMFFFVVGLELKRELLVGELKNPKNAILPILAALGGMLLPALIYLYFNHGTAAADGWGIPMATDIAFALGVLYLLGDKVPLSLKIFLTAIAIVDDIGAVLVIAFFYTSTIDTESLFWGGIVLAVMIGGNFLGVRKTLFYAILGIGGLWLAFLLSGVHATIAAVLAAFCIPASTKIDESLFVGKSNKLVQEFDEATPNNVSLVTHEQYQILDKLRSLSKRAIPPLQRLEHSLHPIVSFIVMPLFAFSNAGITLIDSSDSPLFSTVTVGVILGLIVGKLLGVAGVTYVMVKLKWATLPDGMNTRQILGIGFLSAIGFTMSLFIAGLAFADAEILNQAKFGVFLASVLSSFIGYFIITHSLKTQNAKSP
ncbi:MAG TPA: Na+/H+ antiporter NhaA [Flavobacteriaceae bacterium]|nr:Na+/H+ antiporter NhaA [Flavobacteriaceae bacterium]